MSCRWIRSTRALVLVCLTSSAVAGDRPIVTHKAFAISGYDPVDYFAPQYDGYPAFAVSHGFTKAVDPNARHIKNDRLYLNLGKRVKRKWLKNRNAAIVRADNYRPTALTACEAKNNCYD